MRASVFLALGTIFALASTPLTAWAANDPAPAPGVAELPRAATLTAPAKALERLAERLQRLDEDGLDPAAYAIPASGTDPVAYTEALHRAAVLALTDLLHGRGRQIAQRPDIRRDAASVPLAPWLAELAMAAEPAEVIDRAALRPAEALPLKRELARLRSEAARGGWVTVPPGDTLDPGMTDPVRVPALRARLAAEDAELAAAPDQGPLFDPTLAAAVRRFQASQGIEADGRVGRTTLALLNRPISARIDQLRVALDMRRGVAPEGEGRRVEVNIPDYRLRVLEGGQELLAMAVVVGRTDRQTPMIRSRLTTVQFNPPWGVPVRNAREDLLPRFRRDPVAMMEKGFRVYRVVDGERVEVDPRTINWTTVDPQRFPYVIRQDAGEGNALGRLKLIMPNGDQIFMHDTPDRHHFRRSERALSSGCIRLERPMELVELLLDGTPGWGRERAQSALDSRATSYVPLRRALPVVLRYATVTVQPDGAVRIRPDIYGLDAAYARQMEPDALHVASAARTGG